MNDTLKADGRIGAELGAAKAEVEWLRGEVARAVREFDECDSFNSEGRAVELMEELRAALSQQAEPDEANYSFHSHEFAKAHAEPAPAQDVTVVGYHCRDENDVATLNWLPHGRYCELMTVAQHERIVAALTRPAQTAPQGKFRMGDLVKKSTGSEWKGRVVGWYSTEQTSEGYAVESEAHKGSVQIYPAKALEAVE